MTRFLALTATFVIAAWTQTAFGEETRGVTSNEIIFGMHTDLSGPAATYGVSSSNAVKMRFDEVNASGGIHGRKIKLIVEDTQYQVPRAVQAGTKLIDRDRIFAMIAALGTPIITHFLSSNLRPGCLTSSHFRPLVRCTCRFID